MHSNENRVLKTKITKLEAEVDNLNEIYEAGAEQLKRVLAKEVAENQRLRELVTDLWVLDTDSLVEALEAGDEGEHSA